MPACIDASVVADSGHHTSPSAPPAWRQLLHSIASDWTDPTSLNRRTAAAFASELQRIAAARRRGAHLPGDDAAGQELDVLITGVEVSLWLAQQFAADLQALLPGLRVAAVRCAL